MSVTIFSPIIKEEVIDAYNFAKNILKFSKDHPRDLNFYIEVFNENPKYIVIAKKNDKVVGVVLSSKENETSLLVGELVVSKELRGEGLGSLLMSKIEDNAKTMKKNQISLGAVGKAEGFYLKIGYKPKLFIQVQGNNRLDEIKQQVKGVRIDWESSGDDGYSKIIIDTNGINKNLQKMLEENLNAHTQYLFSKGL
ncbi:GNAT family N-acetyltransferase [Patescibacteria group bacterium]|nr:GNAT family N-acetyltransferase [Patescibacteria group bacterium]